MAALNSNDPLTKLLPDTYTLAFTKPFVNEILPVDGLTAAFKCQTGELPWLKSNETTQGVNLDLNLKTPTGCNWLVHGISLESTWRHLKSENSKLPIGVREALDNTMKNAVKYSLKADFTEKTDSIIPSNGISLNGDIEVAKTGTADHVKFNASSKFYKSIPNTKVTACLSSRIGHMVGKNIELQDKFFVGGPLDLRGYRLNEAGEKTGGNSLLACGLHCYYPLGSNINAHAFATVRVKLGCK